MRESRLWTARGMAGPVDFPVPTTAYVVAGTKKAAAELGAQALGPTLEGGVTVKLVGPVFL